jgi:hypothetical protein
MMLRLTDKPRPVPLPRGLVVKNGSNNRFCASGGMPGPMSRTDTCAPASPPLVSTYRRLLSWPSMA